MTDGALTVQAAARKVRTQLRFMFHPDKSPHSLPTVPEGTPPFALYADVFGQLSEALSYLEGYMGLFAGNGLTGLPGKGNMLDTTQLDTFVSRVLREKKPPCLREHCTLHGWRVETARPRFSQRRLQFKQAEADKREQIVMQ